MSRETTAFAVVDVAAKGSNMYGCQPCPQCGSTFRAPWRGKCLGVLFVECDDCGLREQAHDSNDCVLASRSATVLP